MASLKLPAVTTRAQLHVICVNGCVHGLGDILSVLCYGTFAVCF